MFAAGLFHFSVSTSSVNGGLAALQVSETAICNQIFSFYYCNFRDFTVF